MPKKVPTEKTAVKKLFVLDTNVLLHDPYSILKFQEHNVYIPFVTIEELDNKKVGTQDINRNARAATRLMSEIADSIYGDIEQGFELLHHNGGHAKGRLFFQNKMLDFLPNEHIHKNDNLYLSVLNDLKNIAATEGSKFFGHHVIMVTKDLNLRIKATAMGFTAQDYMHDHAVEDADLLPGKVTVLPQAPQEVYEVVDSWKREKTTFYKVPNPGWITNEFLYVPAESPEENNGGKLFQVIEVDADEGTASFCAVLDYANAKNKVFGITARNFEQQAALSLLMDPDIDFITLLGPAGTGKTLLTLAAALSQIEDHAYEEVIFTRATIPVGEEIGFLPGTEEEKMNPWAGAMFDNLEVLNEIVNDENSNANSMVKRNELLKEKVKVKAMTFMRGRSLQNKFMIIDEAQNLTPKQMKTLLTRAGEGTKIVCMGNLAQIDSPYLSEASSGLTYVAEKFKGWQNFGSLILTKGERSRLANEANVRL